MGPAPPGDTRRAPRRATPTNGLAQLIRTSTQKCSKTDPGSYVPAPQRQRIIALFIAGQSISEIARLEDRNRRTVPKIVHGPEVRRYARELRRKSYRLGDAAMEVIYDGLHWHRRTDLAWKVLESTGVIPFRAEQLQAKPVDASAELKVAS
jgi:hypothetical protein